MIDGVALSISSIGFWPFTWLGEVIDQHIWWLLLLPAIAAYLAYPKVRTNRLRIYSFAAALLIAGAIVLLAKDGFAAERPCWTGETASKLGYCPGDFSFPSGHSAYAFVFVGASLGTSFFPAILVAAIAVALSRMYMGVHTLDDVVGGAVIGLASYFVVEGVIRVAVPWIVTQSERRKLERAQRSVPHFEVRRDVAHILFGTAIVLGVLLFGKWDAELILLLCLFIGMVAMQMRMRGMRAPIFDELFELLERPGVMPAKGALMYTLGALLALSFLGTAAEAAAVIAVVAWGDGMATIAGELLGRRMRLPYNRSKSVPGFLAFFAFGGLAAYLFIGPGAFLLSLACAIVETLDLKIDDNFLVQVAGTAFLLLT